MGQIQITMNSQPDLITMSDRQYVGRNPEAFERENPLTGVKSMVKIPGIPFVRVASVGGNEYKPYFNPAKKRFNKLDDGLLRVVAHG